MSWHAWLWCAIALVQAAFAGMYAAQGNPYAWVSGAVAILYACGAHQRFWIDENDRELARHLQDIEHTMRELDRRDREQRDRDGET